MQAKTERFEMRLDEDTLANVDRWRSEQDDVPTRSEAVRRLVDSGLSSSGRKSVKFSDGESMILMMLTELHEHLKVKGDTDVSLLKDIIYGGHYWALKWEMSGLFHDHVDSERVLADVTNWLDMWAFIEMGYAKLSKKDKDRIEKEAPPLGKYVRFPGFDGNYESNYLHVASFLIKKLGRFSVLKDREMNSHHPTLDTNRRMYKLFEPMRATIAGRELGTDEIIELMKARVHPDAKRS
jgi:uncharacterized protein YfbU (UPF0304 family)